MPSSGKATARQPKPPPCAVLAGRSNCLSAMAGTIERVPGMHKAITLILASFLIALTGEPAVAQGANCVAQAAGTDNSLDQITSLYQNCAKQWEAVLGGYALRLFWLLAAIEFAWAAIR